MLRIKVNDQQLLAESSWDMNEEDMVEFFTNYEPLEYSKINTTELFKMDRTKMIKNENKVYFGQI